MRLVGNTCHLVIASPKGLLHLDLLKYDMLFLVFYLVILELFLRIFLLAVLNMKNSTPS